VAEANGVSPAPYMSTLGADALGEAAEPSKPLCAGRVVAGIGSATEGNLIVRGRVGEAQAPAASTSAWGNERRFGD
jgi:hypothetical protein